MYLIDGNVVTGKTQVFHEFKFCVRLVAPLFYPYAHRFSVFTIHGMGPATNNKILPTIQLNPVPLPQARKVASLSRPGVRKVD